MCKNNFTSLLWRSHLSSEFGDCYAFALRKRSSELWFFPRDNKEYRLPIALSYPEFCLRRTQAIA
ncbi:MAG: hypothetical protein F6K10_00095 [Moorea sp. SIO2B7]|nr:hypothetical protein [Moorena sp. SIO2B7]